jgi:hypothetical protein
MRAAILLFTIPFLLAFAAMGDGQASAAPSARALVLAELFTSEGCSSCPPADDVLRQLVEQQPIDGVEVVGLGEHVDYWDNLGWRDPFSSALMTERQSQYARLSRSRSIYTPQLVVDGRYECVASDIAEVRKALVAAAKLPRIDVAVSGAPPDDGWFQLRVRVDVPPAFGSHDDADVMVAVTEDHLVSNVIRGENKGRTLRHTGVVRVITSIGELKRHELTFSADVPIQISSAWKRGELRAIAFVQERASGHILGSGINNLISRSRS